MAGIATAWAPLAPHRAVSRRAGRRSSRAVARRAVEDAEKPDTTRTQDAASSAVVEEQATSGEIVRLLGVTLSRYTGSGAAMLRNGGAAVRHHAAVARGDTDAVTRPLSWSPLMTMGVELLSGFLEGIAIEDAEVAALRPRDDGETSDSKSAERLLTYLRSLRAMMAVGVPPLPGTRVQRVTVDDVPAVWLTPNARSWKSSRAPRRVLLWFHGGAFVLCNTATHARLMSSMGVAGDARVLSVEYPLAPDQGVYEDMADAADRAYAWLVSERGGNVDRKDVVIGGDSAGGHLALALAQRLAASEANGGARASPAGLVLLSPWLDPGRDLRSTAAAWREAGVASVDYLRAVEASMSSVVELVFGGDRNRSSSTTPEERLPRCLLDASLYAGRSMPPCLIQYGGIEVLASEANGLAEVAFAAGWDDVTLEAFPEMPHVFQVFDSVAPEGAAAISSVGRFMKKNAAARP
jgi:acetyl esterase/lipase